MIGPAVLKDKSTIKIAAPILLCFAVNFLKGNSFSTAILNSIILLLVVIFFQIYSRKQVSKFNPILLSTLGLIPLFSGNSGYLFFYFFLLIFYIFVLVYLSRWKNKFFALISILSIFVISLYANQIIKFPLEVSRELLIMSDKWGTSMVVELRDALLFLPYKIRFLMFNNFVYVYDLVGNVFNLITLKNLYDTLLLANLYPLSLGILVDLKTKNIHKRFFYLVFSVTLLGLTLSRSVDISRSFLVLAPFILYYVLLGLNKVKKKIYYILLFFSLIILFSPIF